MTIRISEPEPLVIVRALFTGFLCAEIGRLAFYLGKSSAQKLAGINPSQTMCGLLIVILLILAYMWKRDAVVVAVRGIRSRRVDLLLIFGIGAWVNELVSASSGIAKLHTAFQTANGHWGLAALLLLCTVMLSPLFGSFLRRPKLAVPQFRFVSDDPIDDEAQDSLDLKSQAKTFADAVLESEAHSGLVFGVDGPWGVGKTSFLNLAEQRWKEEKHRVIVCRLEPLRYASESDLSGRLISEISASIQREIFVPELRPVASRYSRLIKGKADISFLGFRLSLEPSQASADELLQDIDDVLKRINRRVIIVIDDLDRLDAKATNSVLFATQRTFKLSQAAYVLCYDTEVLAERGEDGARSRVFLEKFVAIKMSLFIDSSSIQSYLRNEWQRSAHKVGAISPQRQLYLRSLLEEFAATLKGDLGAKYQPFAGDLRKIKRFVNAVQMIQQNDTSDLDRTDFNKRDLINLTLLHLNYPGLFRRIYAEETDGRSGVFSVRKEEKGFRNSDEFLSVLKEQETGAAFLLAQLFDASELDLGSRGAVSTEDLASRACFNLRRFRNLERYLTHIVRFVTPEPQDTFVLYKAAVDEVLGGAKVAEVLKRPDFQSERWEHAHDQFWRLLVEKSYGFNRAVAEDAIYTLVDDLPLYSALSAHERGLRQQLVYSLLMLLDRVGWGRNSKSSSRSAPNTPENVLEIAWRIFGEKAYQGKGLIERMACDERGVLGWNDLLLFRLYCSHDRGGQLFNLYMALGVHQDIDAPTTGVVSELSKMQMRYLSQRVFEQFKRTYIDSRRNFFAEAGDVSVEALLGSASVQNKSGAIDVLDTSNAGTLEQRADAVRNGIASFVIYQLSNSHPPTGSGVGCGYYDEDGANDSGSIARLMNEYVFGTCFNPKGNPQNVVHFLDHCLVHLSSSFHEDDWIATKSDLVAGLDPLEMGRYWGEHQEIIRQRSEELGDRRVITHNYIAKYRDDLPKVFSVLDELVKDAAA